MRFTELFEVPRPEAATWFDLNVEMDSPLYVDPFLIFDEDDEAWSGAHDQIIEFFAATIDLLHKANGDSSSMHRVKAERFLQCPEPKEFALGLSMGHPEGSGIGPDLARQICESLEFFRVRARHTDSRTLAMVAVIVPGLGVDRISDMVCNILKCQFIDYTESICQELNIATKLMEVRNTGWAAAGCRWSSSKRTLPQSPVFNGGILLTPQRFLKDIPRVTAEGLWTWAEAHESETLRFELNYDLNESLTHKQKVIRGRQLAHRSIDILERYVDQATANGVAYDVDQDPKGLIRWEEAGHAIALASTAPNAPESQEEFETWLTDLVLTFKVAVEDNGLWTVLWNDGNTKHRKERIAQVTARATWIEHCRARDIDITREADCGRGPVDFKFSRGWTMRGLIEVKHIANPQFAHGAQTQLPVYLKGENASFGIYLCIGYSAQDFHSERIAKVEEACRAITSEGKTRIIPIFVDARPKASASKAKA